MVRGTVLPAQLNRKAKKLVAVIAAPKARFEVEAVVVRVAGTLGVAGPM